MIILTTRLRIIIRYPYPMTQYNGLVLSTGRRKRRPLPAQSVQTYGASTHQLTFLVLSFGLSRNLTDAWASARDGALSPMRA